MQHENYAKLLSLNYNLFDITDYDELVDFIVNDSHKLVPYQLAVVYSIHNKRNSKPYIIQISGTVSQDTDVNFSNWLIDVIQYYHQQKEIIDFTVTHHNDKKNLFIFHEDALDDNIKQTWADNLGQEAAIAKLYSNQEQQINMLFFNQVKLDETSLINLNFIIKSYRQAFNINLKGKTASGQASKKTLKYIKLCFIAFGFAMFLPITPSVMAPAEVISEYTWAVNSPINGTIKNIEIDPNTIVKNNTVLFKFDTIDLNNNLRLKEQELKKLETEQMQARALGFQDLEERAKIYRLSQDIAAKRQEISYAKEQFDLSVVKAPAEGTVLYKDKNDLLGKPVRIGETVMRLADINSKAIEIWLNIDDSIKLQKNMDIYYYSNRSPFSAIKARLEYYSYEAYITPKKEIAFRLLAKFTSDDEDLTIGDHGQVKIYAQNKTILGLFVFQKPIAKLRKWLYRKL